MRERPEPRAAARNFSVPIQRVLIQAEDGHTLQPMVRYTCLFVLLAGTLIVLLPSLLISPEFAASSRLWLTFGVAAATAAALLSRPWSAEQRAERRG